ncbi:MAG: CotH kinase family protein [Promethearchaeota archaeon]
MEFVDKPPPSRTWRNLLVFIIISSITVSTLLFFVYFPYPIENESDSSDNHPDFPTIYITCYKTLDNENYSNCIFELDSEESSERIEPLEAQIKIRGETSATYPKVGYRIELSKGEPLLGMRDDADWQLFASYYDYTRLKVKLSFNLWRNLLSTNNPTAILPRSRYVLLYFNGNYQGLYLLAEKNDRKLFGLNKELQNDTDDSLIFQAKDPSNFSIYEEDKWEQDWPNEDEGYYIMDDIMTNLTKFVNSTSDDDFFNETSGIFTKFYKINLIDFFLFNFFILHKDFWHKNYFIIRNTNPSNFSLIPWDFDLTFGQNATTTYSPTENPEYEIRNNTLLYNRLLNNTWFRENCSARWIKLRDGIWSNQSIFNTLSYIYGEAKPYIQSDLNHWNQPVNSEIFINQLQDWISDRLYFCDNHFKYNFV